MELDSKIDPRGNHPSAVDWLDEPRETTEINDRLNLEDSEFDLSSPDLKDVLAAEGAAGDAEETAAMLEHVEMEEEEHGDAPFQLGAWA